MDRARVVPAARRRGPHRSNGRSSFRDYWRCKLEHLRRYVVLAGFDGVPINLPRSRLPREAPPVGLIAARMVSVALVRNHWERPDLRRAIPLLQAGLDRSR